MVYLAATRRKDSRISILSAKSLAAIAAFHPLVAVAFLMASLAYCRDIVTDRMTAGPVFWGLAELEVLVFEAVVFVLAGVPVGCQRGSRG